MKSITNFAEKATGFTLKALILTFVCLNALAFVTNVEAQSVLNREKTVAIDAQNLDDKDVKVPDENVKLVSVTPIYPKTFYNYQIPTGNIADTAADYSNVTTFTNQSFSNGGATTANPITKLVADDLTMTTTSPNVGGFVFSVANLNTVAVSARPRVRFYADNAGVPGTYIAGYSFNPISFGAGAVNTFTATVVPVTLTGQKIWAGITFDNVNATATTAAQLNLLGQELFTGTPEIGISADTAFQTTAAGSFLASNPAGATFNFAGTPYANFGWEIREAYTVTITRDSPQTQTQGGTVTYSVTFNKPVTGVTASNFTLTSTTTGASIVSVSANAIGAASVITVTVNLGTGSGNVGLNFANANGITNSAVATPLPLAGPTYTTSTTTAAGAIISGRVLTPNGRGLSNASVVMIDANGATRTARTSFNGRYQFANVPTGGISILSVNSKHYRFDVASLNINGDDNNINFTALP